MFIKPLFFFEYYIFFFLINYILTYFTNEILEYFIYSEIFIIIFWFIIIFVYNFIYYDKLEYDTESLGENDNDGLDNDLFIKYITIFLNELWYFYSLIITEFKKWNLFTFKFKYFVRIKTNKFFFSENTKNLFLIWRPIFKKWSYLGYYRSNRSKWIK